VNTRLRLLRQRRELLLLRIQAQRLQLASLAQDWDRPLALADTLVVAARRMSRYWLIYTLVLAFFVRSRRGSVGLWLGRAWTAWEIYRSLHPRGVRALRPVARPRSSRPDFANH
jgi:hypothetical protein